MSNWMLSTLCDPSFSDNFPILSANPTSRDNFAKQCAEVVDYYGFDGIDIDWGEYQKTSVRIIGAYIHSLNSMFINDVSVEYPAYAVSFHAILKAIAVDISHFCNVYLIY